MNSDAVPAALLVWPKAGYTLGTHTLTNSHTVTQSHTHRNAVKQSKSHEIHTQYSLVNKKKTIDCKKSIHGEIL